MKEAGLTRQERNLLALTRFLMIAFIFATVLFAALPDWTLSYIGAIGRGIFNWPSPPINLGNERFWLVLGVGLMTTLSYVCFVAQKDLVRNIEYVKCVVIAKFVTAAGFVFSLLFVEARFFYLVGAIIDGIIFAITFYYYSVAVKSRPR